MAQYCAVEWAGCGGPPAGGYGFPERTAMHFRFVELELWRGLGTYDWSGSALTLGFAVNEVHFLTEIGWGSFSGSTDEGEIDGAMWRSLLQFTLATWRGNFYYRYGGGMGIGFVRDIEETIGDETTSIDSGLTFPMCVSAGAGIANLGLFMFGVDVVAGYNLVQSGIGSYYELEGRLGAAIQF